MSKKTKSIDATVKTLKEVSIFNPFADKPEELRTIAKIMNFTKVKKGTAIIKEGEFGDSLYILESGAVNILKRTLEKEDYTVVRLESKKRSIIF
ncbi:MAG: cyclic nucleotide-binding domain-containing protein, partial [Spirochaetes bacterium]|nr:cyclic nucleotide-binding domain-containing protein [Spirochaetota bacterium]